jgi:ABC-type transport system substrate-binding protein
VNSLSPVGPVSSISSTDDKTVVVKLAFPIAGMVSRFAFHRFLSILPKEAEGGFNPQTDQRGSGPWMLRKWEPSVGYTYDRNPAWHLRKGTPYFDTLELRLITEAAQRRAQLNTGNLWVLPGPANNESRSAGGSIDPTEVVGAKKEQPKLNMYDDGYPWGGPNHLAFGFNDQLWQDARVRRALSMVIDRDLWIEANYNVAAFESEGLPMEKRWNTHYCADDAAFWLDPQGMDLSEGAQYFQFNVEEAKKLMQAAGHSSAVKMQGLMQGAGNNQITSLHGMIQGSGLFDVSLVSIPAAEYNQRVYNGSGKFEGLAMAQNMGVRGDIDQYLSTRWSPGGASGTQTMFPEVYPWYKKAQDLVTAQRQELDEKKRKTILADLQKELALQMPTVPYPGAANGFSLAWPQLANFGIFRAVYDYESVIWTRYWYDESKKPA